VTAEVVDASVEVRFQAHARRELGAAPADPERLRREGRWGKLLKKKKKVLTCHDSGSILSRSPYMINDPNLIPDILTV
jgi:hypothetical protein